jgi:chromosome segregation ATPase
MKENYATMSALEKQEALLAQQRAIYAEGEKKLPELEAALAKVREDWRADEELQVNRSQHSAEWNRTSELRGELTRLADDVRDTKQSIATAAAQIRCIEPMLRAHSDVQQLDKDFQDLTAKQIPVAENEVRASQKEVDDLSADCLRAETAAEAEQDEAARLALQARRQGNKPAPAKSSRAAVASVPELTRQRNLAQSDLTSAIAKLAALRTRAEELAKQLSRAMSNAAELDWLQTLEDIRPVLERCAATAYRVGDYRHEVTIPINKEAMLELVKEIERKYRIPQTAELHTLPAPASDASVNESAEPGAEAAA